MKILFTSDLHGNLEAFSRFSELLDRDEFDLGIISGDLMTYNPEKEAIEKKTKKILEMPGKKILFIMGNDDGILDHNWDDTEFLINPDLKKIELYNFNFVGYQYTNPYVGGPFEKPRKNK
jgi:Icc-related predicted phosphoesterase